MERGVALAAPVRLVVVVQPPRWKPSSEGGLDSIFRSLRDLQLCGGHPLSLPPYAIDTYGAHFRALRTRGDAVQRDAVLRGDGAAAVGIASETLTKLVGD